VVIKEEAITKKILMVTEVDMVVENQTEMVWVQNLVEVMSAIEVEPVKTTDLENLTRWKVILSGGKKKMKWFLN
jgi:hypothetical protein